MKESVDKAKSVLEQALAEVKKEADYYNKLIVEHKFQRAKMIGRHTAELNKRNQARVSIEKAISQLSAISPGPPEKPEPGSGGKDGD